MSQVQLVIQPRASDLGSGFIVKRSLPSSKKRMVGPFIFLDHMGPVKLTTGEELIVRAHPHIGLSTLTWLFSGEIMHRDSLGYIQPVKPGEVNWMTAGRGIAHSERSYLVREGDALEGIQVWIALPKEKEDIEPSFTHVAESRIPELKLGNTLFKLVAGRWNSVESPVPVHSDLFYLVGDLRGQDHVDLDVPENSEAGVYVTKGSLEIEGVTHGEGTLIVTTPGARVRIKALETARLIVIGGEPLPEERFVFWNFVSHSPEKIEAAKKLWAQGKFARVVDEEESIPLPDERR